MTRLDGRGAGDREGGEQRRTRRTKVFLVAEVAGEAPEAADAHRRAHVLDISPQGARLHARSVSQAGTAVDLVVGDARQAGSIVWVRHPNFGVRFAEPLSPERLDRIVAAPDRRAGE